MCNRARMLGEPETLIERFGAGWITDKPRDNRFDPVELRPKGRARLNSAQLNPRHFSDFSRHTLWPATLRTALRFRAVFA